LFARLAQAFADLPAAESWAPREVHVLPDRVGLVAVGDAPKPLADCTKNQPLVLVGKSGAWVGWLTSGLALTPQGGSVFWDLRGDGSPFLVVEERLCNFASTERVYGLDARGEWHELEGDARPRCPSCPRPSELSLDGRPLFSTLAATLVLASGGPYFPTSVEVSLAEIWDGTRFRSDLPTLEPLYRQRLEAARTASKQARAQRGGCNRAAFQAAGEIYVYARMLGAAEPAALAEAERAVSGLRTEPCKQAHAESMYGSQSYDWAAIREELQAQTTSLPVLGLDGP
jgi:hypothetical protein